MERRPNEGCGVKAPENVEHKVRIAGMKPRGVEPPYKCLLLAPPAAVGIISI